MNILLLSRFGSFKFCMIVWGKNNSSDIEGVWGEEVKERFD